MAAMFGRASDFLSEADLLRFRGLTNLLHATNGIDDRLQNGGLGFMHNNENSKNNVLYRRLAEFNDLLVRHLEVIAVRSADKNGTLVHILTDPDRDDDETSEYSPENDGDGDGGIGHVYYTANPDPETNKKKGKKKKGMENRVAPLLVEVIAEPAEPMDSAGAWLLKHTIGTKRKAPKTSITLDKHGSMLASDGDALRTRARLHNYALLASIAKIRGRIIRGTAQHDRNLWEFLTKQSTDVHTARGNEKHIPFQPSNVKGMPIPHWLLRRILASCQRSKFGLAPELEPWLDRTDEVKYTTDTRPVFQTLLSGLLIAVDAALLDLVNIKHKRLMDKGKGKLSDEQVAKAALELDSYAATASQWLRLLSALLDQMRPVVQAHLSYLKDVFAITKIKHEGKQRRELNASPSNFLAEAPSSDRLDQPSSKLGPSQSLSSDKGLEDSEIGLERTVSKQAAYSADFEEIDSAGLQQNWDWAALKYMDLLCLHQKAVNSLGKSSGDSHDKKVHSFLKATRFKYVSCFQDQADCNMMSMRTVMETLKLPSGNEFGSKKVAKIKAFIQDPRIKNRKPAISDTKWEDEENFDGNFHCETLMLSLQLLHKTQAARNEVRLEENNKHPYLQLPSKDIVDRFGDSAKVLSVSKKCCPACHVLMKYVNENADGNILYPGHHENWFTTALPPWLPLKAGMAVIKAAETKLVERVQRYTTSGTSLSDLSTGTSPITSYRVDHLGDVDYDGIPTPADWLKKLGEKRKRRKSEERPDSSRSSSPTKRRQEM